MFDLAIIRGDLPGEKPERLEWPVEPPDKGEASEHQRQAAFVALMPRIAPRVLVFAIPNGTNVPSNAGRNKLRREGLCTGFPDTGVLWAGGVAFIEWKSGKGAPSPEQIRVLNALHLKDIPVAVARTAEWAIEWLASAGCPVPRCTDG